MGWVRYDDRIQEMNQESPEARPMLRHVAENEVEWEGRRLAYFGGSDYLRLSWRREIREAIRESLLTEPSTLGASRVTTGNHPVHGEIEARMSIFLQMPSVVLTSTGYTSSLVAGQILGPKITDVFLDSAAHGCLRDGAQLTGARIHPFRSGDPIDLEAQMASAGSGARVAVFTNGLGAHDGAIPPLKRYLEILPPTGWLLVDDAHGVGTVGSHGGGVLDAAGISDPRVLLTMTFSKAFGVYGGAVAGPGWVSRAIWDGSRVFGGATPMSVANARGILASLEILRSEGAALRTRLEANVDAVHSALGLGKRDIRVRPGPQFSVVPGSLEESGLIRARLLERGIYPTLIRYFGGPAPEFFRFAIASRHQPDQLAALAQVVTRTQSQAGAESGL